MDAQRRTRSTALGEIDVVHVDRRVADLAGRQDGVVSHAQLRALGLTRGALAHRIKHRRLIPIHRGVYAVGHEALSPNATARAALFAVGEGGLQSHRSARAEWGLGKRPPTPELTVVGRRPRSPHGVTIHYVPYLRSSDIRSRNGLALTAPARTILDLAAVEPIEAVELALAEAQVRGLVRPADIRAAAARATSRRGVAALLAVLDTVAPTRSELERAMLRIIRAAQLPEPLVNARLDRHELDFRWPAQRLIVETDGWAAHGSRRAFENDRARDVEHQAAGWRTARFTWRQIRRRPLWVAAKLAQLLAQTS